LYSLGILLTSITCVAKASCFFKRKLKILQISQIDLYKFKKLFFKILLIFS
jgi:hypothetical protein